LISSNLSNPRKLWSAINKLLNRKSHSLLPTDTPQSSLPQLFANFFSDKVRILHSSIISNSTNPTALVDPPFEPPILSHFSPLTRDEVSKLIGQSSDTFCDLDPIPTSLLKQCLPVLLPTITNIINLSLSSGTFPDQFKACSVLPLLKKYNLDKEELSNYRPISHLSFLSKLVERAVKARLCDHLSANHLFNSFQSAYTKFHSTESTLLAIHDYIIKSMSNQKVTALCLLDLSAAFDTIDHSILYHRLSTWFGLHDLTLSWIKSYLSGRNFLVNVNGLTSTSLPLPHGVPQGSVLGPLLFILYTTPLSSLIADSSINHHLYADDTQLYISFSPLDFCSNILSLQNTISLISDWMSANLLSLNQSKTEFLVIGLPQQLSKLSNPSLSMPSNSSITPTVAARNLGVIFDSTLSMSNHISAVSKTCFFSIRDLRRIRNTLDSSTAKTIATSLIHSKVDYCNSLFLNLPKCELDRLQLILNSTALELFIRLQNSLTLLQLSSLFIGLKLMSAFLIKFYLSPTNVCSSTNLLIFINYSKFSLTLPLVLLPVSLCNALLSLLVLKLPIALFLIKLRSCGIVFPRSCACPTPLLAPHLLPLYWLFLLPNFILSSKLFSSIFLSHLSSFLSLLVDGFFPI